jgi:hypothetical protein
VPIVVFFLITGVLRQNCWLHFLYGKNCINVYKHWAGLHFGRFFHKHIWSPWHRMPNNLVGRADNLVSSRNQWTIPWHLFGRLAHREARGQFIQHIFAPRPGPKGVNLDPFVTLRVNFILMDQRYRWPQFLTRP